MVTLIPINVLGLGLAILNTPSVIANVALVTKYSPSRMTPNQPVVAIQSSPSIEENLQKSSIPTQVTSVSALSDVKPADWVFQVWRTLVERYGCSAGYTNTTYWGKRALSRYEFATGLNTCLDQVSRLIDAAPAGLAKQEDLATLRRLQVEFATELASIRRRVDNLEAHITKLSAQSFSVTTKLTGEAVLVFSGANGGTKADEDNEQVERNLAVGNRIRLNFDTSFTGDDRLRVRLQTTNVPSFSDATGTDMARLSLQGNDENEVEATVVEYRLPVGEQARVYIEVVGGGLDDFTDTLNPLSGSSRGSISRFGQRNPIYRQSGGAGAGINYKFDEAVSLSLGYLGLEAPAEEEVDDSESSNNGIPYGAIAQLTLQPAEDVGIGLTYVRSYNDLDTGTGSELANDPFDDESEQVTANSYGVEVTLQVSPVFTFGGWVGFTKVIAEDLSGRPEASILNYAVTLAFQDLAQEGDLAGVVIGQPPKVTRNDLSTDLRDKNTSLHLEAFYRFQATKNITITPGLLVITNPEHDQNNDTICVGTVRTTFSF